MKRGVIILCLIILLLIGSGCVEETGLQLQTTTRPPDIIIPSTTHSPTTTVPPMTTPDPTKTMPEVKYSPGIGEVTLIHIYSRNF